MKFVDPIEKDEDITLMYRFMMKHNKPREAHMFVIGCNLSLRIGDLLKLKFSDLHDTVIEVKEQKTGKTKQLTFNKTVMTHVNLLKEYYLSKFIEPVYLFQSLGRNVKDVKAVSSSYVNRIITEAGEGIMLPYNVGTHSMRKTWAYRAYRDNQDIKDIQVALNHSSESDTLRYIGITKRKISNMYITNEVSVL